MSEQLGITVKKEENFSEWYTQVIQKSELADYSPVKGCMVIKPYGYAIWENIQKIFDSWLKETGVKNAYFPMFIPEALLKKEAEHFEGFTPEVAWITKGGDRDLEEKLAVRPTSETIMYSIFSEWIRSHRDLPLRINQWCNVVRWETKATKLFLRTREFLWQEGHTVHATKEEAEEEVMLRLKQYKKLVEEYLAIPVIDGKKSEGEKFAGALFTTTLESLMSDKKALQMGTSHHLGQHFSKAFEIKFLDKDSKEKYAWQTSWGISTRLIGALVMVHSDNKGLVLPPKIAPLQIVIIPIGAEKTKSVINKAREVKRKLERHYSVEIDEREEYTPGWKFNYWELKGVPIRIEIGPKDVENKKLTIFRRDLNTKQSIDEKSFEREIKNLIENIQKNLFEKARKFLDENTFEVNTYEGFKELIEKGGFIKAKWCGEIDCEKKIKEDTTATVRVIPFKQENIKGRCVFCERDAKIIAYFAKSY
ncbi:MAG: proline--tRNA ligase [Candidatus Aenigmatarchaeota archaeon]|nr:proline--tRNA ligase [Candidatus Aenigmarchaeota archaeon]